MRKPLKAKSSNRGQTVAVYTQAAPIKGWVSSENIVGMDPQSAYQLDNWFPETNSIILRAGFGVHSSVPGFSPITTLMAYKAGATEKLFAVAAGGIYDVTIDSMSSDPFSSPTMMLAAVANNGYRNPRYTMPWNYNFRNSRLPNGTGPF